MSGTTKYGDSALFSNTTGANNSAFGNYAAYNNLDASCNTAVGSNALFNNTTGPHNTAIGAGAMCNNVGGQLNTAVGSSALEGLTSAASVGDNNVAIGAQALYNNSDASCNTAIGTFSGYYNTSGDYNTFIGFDADVSNNGIKYQYSTALGYNSIIDASNQIVLGTSNENVKIPGSYVGINGVYNLSGSPHVYNLDVSGNINFSGNLYQNGLIYDASGGSSQWSNGTGSSIYYPDTVGIGTNSPNSLYALDVSGSANITLSDASSNNPNLTLSGGVSGGGGAYLQLLGSGNAGENVGINLDTFSGRAGGPATTIRSVDNGNYSGNLQFLTANTSGSNSNNPQSVSMIIKPQETGNAFVGIGTIDPSYNLDVSGILQVQDGTFDPIFTTTLHGLNVSALNFYYNPKTPTNINSFKIELDGANCLIYKGTPNPFSYQDASATVIQNDGGNGGIALVSTSTYIYVNKNGSTPGVGIMTSNPQYTLDVSGNINFTGSLLEDGAPFSGTTQWTTSGLNIYYNTGTVGIGTASPNTTYKLDVNGKVNATLYNSTSDYRIKENVTQLDSTFVVDNLNPVTYLNNKLGKQDIGLIAHELQEIYPELVNGEKDGEQFQSVNYLGLIPILIKEIKELKKEIKSVKTELNELKNK